MGLGELAFKAIRSAYKYATKVRTERAEQKQRFGADEDLLVKDPLCGVYIPKSQAFLARIDGAWEYFCSRECMVAYRLEKMEKDKE